MSSPEALRARSDEAEADGPLCRGSVSLPSRGNGEAAALAGQSLWYLKEGQALIYLGFAPPDAPGLRLPAALRRRLRGLDLRALSQDPEGEVAQQLAEYGAGSRRSFTLPLRLLGTPFQRQVWMALAEVPYGRTLTYAQLAAAAGRAEAVRAAAGAVAANPLSVLVPCHRVVPAAGGTGNYGAGPQRKRTLLALEGVLEVIEGHSGPKSENPAGELGGGEIQR